MSIRPTKTEIGALVPLLEQDWDSPEALASALIQAVDKARAERRLYVGVLQYGGSGGPLSGPAWYIGLGWYPGLATARNAAISHPGASLATKIAVVPVVSSTGLDQLVRDIEKKPTKGT